MISWMQHNNKFLIVTIWIATISFIFTGATYGFSYGLRSNNIGEVGDITLKKDRFQMEYQNLYSRYNQMFQGKFDEEQAKQMGLQEQVLNMMASQAKILNLAKAFGIIVSDQELGTQLASISAFQQEGKFNKSIYENHLKNTRMSAKTFENSLRESLIIQKTFKLLNITGLDAEYNAFATPFEVADKLKYVTLSTDDMNVTVDDTKLKEYWEVRKDQYQTLKQYTFDMVWTKTDDINVTDEELKKYFDKNSFNYIGAEDKPLTFDEAQEKVMADFKLEKSKKSANMQYIAFKKGESAKDETVTYNLNDLRLPREVWDAVTQGNKGDILKPKVVNHKYVTLKIAEIIEPRTKSFEEAKNEITAQYKEDSAKEQLSQLAQSTLTNLDKEEGKVSEFLTLNNIEKQNFGLNKQENANFGSKLFTSDQEKGMISIGKKVVVYEIVDQKIVTIDANQTESLDENADRFKEQAFETNLMQKLDKKYPTEIYK